MNADKDYASATDKSDDRERQIAIFHIHISHLSVWMKQRDYKFINVPRQIGKCFIRSREHFQIRLLRYKKYDIVFSTWKVCGHR